MKHIKALWWLVALSSICLVHSHRAMAAEPKAAVFSELSLAEAAGLNRQRALVAATLKQRCGVRSLTRTKADLPAMQRLLNGHVYSRAQTYELQCLGVAFGDVLAGELGLRWVMVTDEYGTDPTLRFGDASIQINALTMISKRVERGDAIDLVALLRANQEQLAKARKAAGP